MKDAAVETISTVPDEEKREDAVNEAIETYIKAKKQLGYGGMLPPDVFLGLKFSDAGTTTEVRGHLQSVLTVHLHLPFTECRRGLYPISRCSSYQCVHSEWMSPNWVTNLHRLQK